MPRHFSILFLFRTRCNHHRCSVGKAVLRNFKNFTGKHLCRSLFFNKVAGLSTATILKKRFQQKCFLVNFAKFLRTIIFKENFGK